MIRGWDEAIDADLSCTLLLGCAYHVDACALVKVLVCLPYRCLGKYSCNG